MEIFELLISLVNGTVAILNGILDIIERLFSPVINLIDRWNNLFGKV